MYRAFLIPAHTLKIKFLQIFLIMGFLDLIYQIALHFNTK